MSDLKGVGGCVSASPVVTPTWPPKAPSGGGIFSPENLARHVHSAFDGVPSDHTKALVGYWTTDGKWRMTVAYRVGDAWEMGATFGKDLEAAGITGGLSIKGSW